MNVARRSPGPRTPTAAGAAQPIRRIAEEKYILVVLLAGFGLIFLLIFPPAVLVGDSWMTLMAGREVWENGLPSVDELTVYGIGSTWTDQQWLAQLVVLARTRSAGTRSSRSSTAASVVAAFSIAAAASRSLGAGARAIWVMFLPVLVAAPGRGPSAPRCSPSPCTRACSGFSHRRPGGRRTACGSRCRCSSSGRTCTGASRSARCSCCSSRPTSSCQAEEARGGGASRSPRSRRWPRSPPRTGPVDTARYFHLLLVDPPFAGRVTEWHWADPAFNTMFFYALAAIAIPIVWLGRRRLTLFDVAALALAFVGAVTAIRGIVWFALACMVFVPVAIGHAREPRPGRASAKLVAISAVSPPRSSRWPSRCSCGTSRGSRSTGRRKAVETVRTELQPGDRVFAPDRFSDWLLWRFQSSAAVAYDVRFEVYDRAFFDRLAEYNGEAGDWSFAEGYRITLVDETRRSHTAEFLRGRRARRLPRRRDHDRAAAGELTATCLASRSGRRRARATVRPAAASTAAVWNVEPL